MLLRSTIAKSMKSTFKRWKTSKWKSFMGDIWWSILVLFSQRLAKENTASREFMLLWQWLSSATPETPSLRRERGHRLLSPRLWLAPNHKWKRKTIMWRSRSFKGLRRYKWPALRRRFECMRRQKTQHPFKKSTESQRLRVSKCCQSRSSTREKGVSRSKVN